MMSEFRSEAPKLRSPDREVRQVTHRSFESYMNLFNLPEGLLAEAVTVVDVGAGFASFTEEARTRIPGLRVIALDPVYQSMKVDLHITVEQLEKQEGVHLNFEPEYRGEDAATSLDEQLERDARAYRHFLDEMEQHPSDYVAGSHQNIPLEDKSAGLVLASNSILRGENKPSIVKQALRECLRILKEHGEIRIAGKMTCFAFNPNSGMVELWYSGTLSPGGPHVAELERTGHYADPELMSVFKELEATGVSLYGVVLRADKEGEVHHRVDTLILRKDTVIPEVQQLASKYVRSELKKLQFHKTDGFNIPWVAV